MERDTHSLTGARAVIARDRRVQTRGVASTARSGVTVIDGV